MGKCSVGHSDFFLLYFQSLVLTGGWGWSQKTGLTNSESKSEFMNPDTGSLVFGLRENDQNKFNLL